MKHVRGNVPPGGGDGTGNRRGGDENGREVRNQAGEYVGEGIVELAHELLAPPVPFGQELGRG